MKDATLTLLVVMIGSAEAAYHQYIPLIAKLIAAAATAAAAEMMVAMMAFVGDAPTSGGSA